MFSLLTKRCDSGDMEHSAARSKNTYFKQCFRVTNDVEQTAPMRHFCLARATNYHVERDIEMVQKLDDGRKVTALRIRR